MLISGNKNKLGAKAPISGLKVKKKAIIGPIRTTKEKLFFNKKSLIFTCKDIARIALFENPSVFDQINKD